jgi:site-specific DNA recombinase
VQRIFADYVAGKSINRLVNELNAEGVPTASGRGRWHKPTVWKVLGNRAYLGEARMMRRKYHNGHDGRAGFVWRSTEETVPLPEGTIPPLVDQATFDRVQLRLERNKEAMHDPQAKTDTLLRGGFVKCGSCGCNMVVVRQRKYTFYKCQTSERMKGECVWHTISATALDAAVWSRVEAILSEPERLRRILAVPTRDLAAEIAEIDSRIEELQREYSNLAGLVRRLGEGDDATEGLLDEMREGKHRQRALEESRHRLADEAEDAEARARRVEATIEAVSGLSEQVAALDYHSKRQVLIDLDVTVAVYPSRHESPYHWVMKAFDRDDRGRHLWLDSAPAARSLSFPHQQSSRCRSAEAGSR